MAILYRCRTPTDRLCACGKVARRLRRAGIDFEEVRVPVLVHDEHVICDSHRIVEYLDWIAEGDREPAEVAG